MWFGGGVDSLAIHVLHTGDLSSSDIESKQDNELFDSSTQYLQENDLILWINWKSYSIMNTFKVNVSLGMILRKSYNWEVK